MKIVYISGALIGNGSKELINKNIQTAREYANVLASKKIGVFCPHIYDLDPNIQDLTERQRYFYNLDSEFLINSDAVVFIPGWETSFGARQEEKIADALELPKFYPKSPSDTAEIEAWYYKDDNSCKEAKDRKDIDWSKVIDIRRSMAKYVFAKAG